MSAPHEVVVTGIGIVTSLGIGAEEHVRLLGGKEPLKPVVDTDWLPPYSVHPMPEIDWSTQIPRKGDQRQMENWQRLGVYTAGLALDDAGLKEDLDACATMDLIVSAGGGERDVAVDTLIVEEGRKAANPEILLNEKLTTELRPTLFLAQLSNLLAGNISIVHKVTGSSRTFMGEEGAGVSAFEIARARIAAGQSTHSLVGGAFVAEREDTLLEIESTGMADHTLAASGNGGGRPEGIVFGSGAAFLVLESRSHAQARGARVYAALGGIEGDRGRRDGPAFEARLARLADRVAPDGAGADLVLSGASALPRLLDREASFLAGRFGGAALRSQASAFGNSKEAQFPLAMALAALALSTGAPVAPFDPQREKPMQAAAKTAIVTSLGIHRGEGMARLSAV